MPVSMLRRARVREDVVAGQLVEDVRQVVRGNTKIRGVGRLASRIYTELHTWNVRVGAADGDGDAGGHGPRYEPGLLTRCERAQRLACDDDGGPPWPWAIEVCRLHLCGGTICVCLCICLETKQKGPMGGGVFVLTPSSIPRQPPPQDEEDYGEERGGRNDRGAGTDDHRLGERRDGLGAAWGGEGLERREV